MNRDSDADALHQRESAFHDQWAHSTDASSIHPEAFFEHPTSLENRFLVGLVGDFQDLRVLDTGCGLGESSVYFARRGARVTALDLSPEMIVKTRELAKSHGVTVEAVAHQSEQLPFDDNQFDLVYLANVIHHVDDRQGLLEEARRVLKPGGLAFSWDPVAYNPVINIYRRMATEVRTPDESPLTRADFDRFRSIFPGAQKRHTWLLTLLLFLKYYWIDRLDPNRVRYWKRIMEESEHSLWWWRPLAALDRWLLRCPGLCWWSWNVSFWGRKPDAEKEGSGE